MKVWYCGHRQAAFKDAAGQCPRFENPRADTAYGCREMQLVPTDARIVSGESEHCNECGQAYDEVYALPDALWASIHERAPAGLLCPNCALSRVVSLVSVSDPAKTAT